ncbi:hypothetical protein [Kitasatospora sp. NPDC098663]|uniref:hypothetical protein n=1 Tax=Kitasatospora sp. NPDC098663 TaxID=3364096 RepID=UPI0038156AD0
MTGPRRPEARFGWHDDLGEFVIAPQSLPHDVVDLFDETGFWYWSDTYRFWNMSQNTPEPERVDNAANAVRRLADLGWRLRNCHAPQHRTADVVRHYNWLTSQAPFPDAEATSAAARAEAAGRLHRPQPAYSLETTVQIASGELLVEARRTIEGSEWMIASERDRPDHYLELLHTVSDGRMSITGDVNPAFAGEARRLFRQTILRDFRLPNATRACAATASSRLPAPTPPPAPGRASPPSTAAGRRR